MGLRGNTCRHPKNVHPTERLARERRIQKQTCLGVSGNPQSLAEFSRMKYHIGLDIGVGHGNVSKSAGHVAVTPDQR